MNTDQVLRTVSPAATGASPRTAAGQDGGSPEFRRLLESLERLVHASPAQAVGADADQLKSALQKADDDFTTAMDLRRRLEEAFAARAR